MSSQFEIASTNKGLFNRGVLQKFISEEHASLAKKIKDYFNTEKNKNPYELTPKQLSNLSEDDTIDYYIKPILECLGYKYRKKLKDSSSSFPDVWLFLSDPEENSAEYLQRHNLTILEAKKYKIDLDLGDSRQSTPPEQLSKYIETNLESNSSKRWGILSNGYKWRLYSATFGIDKYIEFDIDHALENKEELELFCLIFSPQSFIINSKREDLLLKMHNSSLESWVQVTNEIQERGNKILIALANGFFEEGSSLEESKAAAYNTLFKLLYALFIESKHLIPKVSVAYHDISLRLLLHDLFEATLSEYEISKRLTKLFKAYHLGEDILPQKFGGEHFEIGVSIKIKNKWLRTALELLTVFSVDKNIIKFFDYSSLNVELIGNIYEGTLGLVFNEKAKKVEIKKIKKKTGASVHSTGTTYTPADVVKYLISETFPKKFEQLPTVCDPACGSGHFLIQGLRYLTDAINPNLTNSTSYQQHKRSIALKCIFGSDINDLAAKLTRLMLVIETSEKGVSAADYRNNIKSCDSLLVKWKNSDNWVRQFKSSQLTKDKGFNFVIGNPPYVRADEPGQKDNRDRIVKSAQYKFLYKKWDLFIPFIELAVGLTKKTKGSVAYVVSDGITYAPYADECTRELSKSKNVKFVSHFTKPFLNWTFPATCFVIDQSTSCPFAERRIHQGNNTEVILKVEKTKNAFLNSDKEKAKGYLSNWPGLVLSDVFYISKGMCLHSDEKLKNISFKKEDLLIENTADKDHPVRYIDNDDIDLGFIGTKKMKYIEYGPGLKAPLYVSRPTFPELHSDKRILLSRSKKGGSAAQADGDIIVSDNTIVLKKWSELIGVENRSIASKAKKHRLEKFVSIPELVNPRVIIEEVSELVSEKLVLGILISDFFMNWINGDKRHKHVISPDVVTDMPIPILIEGIKLSEECQYDLKFQTQIKKLEKINPEIRFSELVFHIENLVDAVIVQSSNREVKELCQRYLNRLVEMLYEPVVRGIVANEYKTETILKAIVENEEFINQDVKKG